MTQLSPLQQQDEALAPPMVAVPMLAASVIDTGLGGSDLNSPPLLQPSDAALDVHIPRQGHSDLWDLVQEDRRDQLARGLTDDRSFGAVASSPATDMLGGSLARGQVRNSAESRNMP